MLTTTGTGGCAPTAVAFAAATFAIPSTANVLLVVRRRVVMATHYRRSTGVVLRFALTVTGVCGQCGRRARKEQEQSGQKDESVDG